MPYLEESKRVVIVGIPGVGKTTLVTKVVEYLKNDNQSVSVQSYGTVMFEQAQNNGIKDRDDIRKLPIVEQHELQKMAAEKIFGLKDDIVIIDTHAFIATPAGFNPGLPYHVLKIIKPTHFIAVTARPEEIYNRKMKDETRKRDIISIDSIKKELSIQQSMLSACSVLSGSPVTVVQNSEGKVEEAARSVINAIRS